MTRASLLLLTAALALSSVALSGCPGDDDGGNGGSCQDYTPPTTFDAQTPAVSFARDVMPIFGKSCGFSTCHGSTSGDANGVFLGGQDAARVHGGLVGVASTRLPAMSLVKAGDPRESFLLRKMDASHCTLDAQCERGSCGDSMPRNEPVLSVETRDVVRRWIAQGAKND